MNSLVLVTVFLAMAAVLVTSLPHQHCKVDPDCDKVLCTDPHETAYCHELECHCHAGHECLDNKQCRDPNSPFYCGPKAVCEHGHCHGDCKHHK